MVVDGYGQDLLRPLLAYDVFVEGLVYLRRRGEVLPEGGGYFFSSLVGHYVAAQLDALVTYVDAGTGYELAHLALALATERALQLFGTFGSG